MRRRLILLSLWLIVAGLICLGQQPRAQLGVTGIGGGGFGDAAAYVGPGNIASGATAWWGLRGYNTAYVGNAANICTPLDAVCLDVTIVGGSLNTTTLGTLACNNLTTICTIKILYDQSGAGSCSGACDLSQATIANRPLYVAPGAANGCPSTALPCMSFSGTQSLVSSNLAANKVAPNTISSVLKFTGTPAFQAYFGNTAGGSNFVGHWNTADNWRINAGSNLQVGSVSDASWHAMQGLFDSTGNFYIDGSSNTGSAGTDTVNSGTGFILGGNSFGASWVGFGVEAGWWNSDTSATFSTMNSNQHAYWSL